MSGCVRGVVLALGLASALGLAGGLGGAAGAQTLARRGWAGSGITVEPWWRDTVFYEVEIAGLRVGREEQGSGQEGVGAGVDAGKPEEFGRRLDYLQGLGVEVIALSLPPDGSGQGGTESGEDFDRLMLELGRRKMRVVVDLPMGGGGSKEEFLSRARYWLSRGVAGLRLVREGEVGADAGVSPVSGVEEGARVRELRGLLAKYGGGRVLILGPRAPEGDGGAVREAEGGTVRQTAGGRVRGARGVRGTRARETVEGRGAEMRVDDRLARLPGLSAEGLRAALRGIDGEGGMAAGVPLLVSERKEGPRRLGADGDGDGGQARGRAKVLAAAVLLSRGDPWLIAGQELGLGNGAAADAAEIAMENGDRASVLSWYRGLGDLRRAHGALRTKGAMEVLRTDDPDVVAWVRRVKAGAGNAAVVVVCNVSRGGKTASLAPALRAVGVRVSDGGLHTLGRSWDVGSGSSGAGDDEFQSADGLVLPPYGVYVGEMRGQRGLEAVVLPARRSRRRRR